MLQTLYLDSVLSRVFVPSSGKPLPTVTTRLPAASASQYRILLGPELKRVPHFHELQTRAVNTVAVTRIKVLSPAKHCGQGMRCSAYRDDAIMPFVGEEPICVVLSGFCRLSLAVDAGKAKTTTYPLQPSRIPLPSMKPHFLDPSNQVFKCEDFNYLWCL